MATNKKQKLNWLFNYPDAKKAVILFGARNLTVIEAVRIVNGKEEVINTYDKMVQYGEQEANSRVIGFIKRETRLDQSELYVYYRFKRKN